MSAEKQQNAATPNNESTLNEKEVGLDSKEVVNETYEEYYEDYVNSFDEGRRKKLLRKVDWHMLPCLTLLYLVAHLDRANIGNAKIEGMEADLGMTGSDYNVVTAIFFIPYIILESPSNIVMKKFFNERPSLWIGGLCVTWGTIMTLHGIVQNYGGMLAARFFLGIAEAGFFPGAMALISNWYLKYQLQTRVAIFYTASAFSGSLSGLLAFAIAKLDGTAGVEGWRWIFILEGIATVVIGASTFFILPDTPEKSRWLDEDEARYIRFSSIIQDGGKKVSEHSHKFDWPLIRSVLLDWKLYVTGMIFWSATGPIYGIKFTLPEIIKSMGFKSANAQLLTIPPYAIGGTSAWIVSKISDKFQWRMPFITVPLLVALVGFAVLCGLAAEIASNIGPCYFAVCLMCAGFYPITPGVNAWTANNLAGPAKRSFGVGYFVSLGNLGAIIGSFMYINTEKPTYPTGYGLSLALTLWGAILAVVLDYVLWRMNKKKEKISKEEVHEMYTDEQLAALGDSSPLFKYTL